MMHHKNLPSSDAKELVRVVTTYQNLSVRQLLRYFPHMGEDIFSRLADRLSKEGRIYYDKAARRVLAAKDIPENPELSMSSTVPFPNGGCGTMTIMSASRSWMSFPPPC